MNRLDQKRREEYDQWVKEMTPNSPHAVGYFRAFWVGGVICVIGQLISMMASRWLHLNILQAGTFTSMAMVFLGTLLTGLGVYDRLGKYAGAGSIVPITGFANSVAAPAMEFRREGMVMGVGAKLFQMAGPVLVYGTTTSVIIGLIYWILGR